MRLQLPGSLFDLMVRVKFSRTPRRGCFSALFDPEPPVVNGRFRAARSRLRRLLQPPTRHRIEPGIKRAERPPLGHGVRSRRTAVPDHDLTPRTNEIRGDAGSGYPSDPDQE